MVGVKDGVPVGVLLGVAVGVCELVAVGSGVSVRVGVNVGVYVGGIGVCVIVWVNVLVGELTILVGWIAASELQAVNEINRVNNKMAAVIVFFSIFLLLVWIFR